MEEGGEAVEGHARRETTEGGQGWQGKPRRCVDGRIQSACDFGKCVSDGGESVEERLLPQLAGFVTLQEEGERKDTRVRAAHTRVACIRTDGERLSKRGYWERWKRKGYNDRLDVRNDRLDGSLE